MYGFTTVRAHFVSKSKWRSKVLRLENDITSMVEQGVVQAIFLCEFGQMRNVINRELVQQSAASSQQNPPPATQATKNFFEEMLRRLRLDVWEVFADAPYVALVDISVWEVVVHEKVSRMCTDGAQRAQHLLLRHVGTDEEVRVLNNHQSGAILNSPTG